jgi:cellulose biosynthesis protein BcsQ
MGHLITIAGEKGGTGKTTAAFNLAAIFAHCGHRTVLADLDPSGDAAAAAAVTPAALPPARNGAALDSEAKPAVRTAEPLPSPRARELSVVALELANDEESEATADQTRSLLDRLREEFQLVVIDCPGRWGPCTRAAIQASDLVLVPMQLPLDAFAARAARKAVLRLSCLEQQAVGAVSSPPAASSRRQPLLRGLAWAVAPDNTDDTETSSAGPPGVSQQLPLLEARVTRDPAVMDALACGRPLIDHDPGARATQGFIEVAREVLALIRQKETPSSGAAS